MKTFNLVITAFLLLLTFSCSTESTEEEQVKETTEIFVPETKQIEIVTLETINAYRISIGLSSLQQSDLIKSQAYSHSSYMATVNEASHANFSERYAFLSVNANAKKVSENVAYGFKDPIVLVQAWLDSEGHKNAIEGDFTHFDISAEQDKEGNWYYTNIFIKK